jgi:hypothetical protein
LLLLLEPVEQLPDEPPTLDETLRWCVLDEPLQLYAIAKCVGIAARGWALYLALQEYQKVVRHSPVIYCDKSTSIISFEFVWF